jgi:hypothetical protein
MGCVRPFIEEDIPKVARLHSRIFRTGDSSSPRLQQSYRAYFAQIFLKNPWRDSTMPSLVYEAAGGNIVGFLGVLPRRLSMNGRPVRAAVSSQFIVDPDCRSTLAGLQLLKAFLAGPQDLSMADEANDVSRRLWEGHGGATSLLYSLYWLRLLRPAHFLLSRFGSSMFSAALLRSFTPVCRVIDAISARLPMSPFQQKECGVLGEELDAEALSFYLSEFSRSWSLRPDYNDQSIKWLLNVLVENRTPGNLQKVAVKNRDGQILGWYLYHLTPGGLGEVLQIGAKPGAMIPVLDHLFHHAWSRGATALSGRIEPRYMQQFWQKNSVFQYRGYWMLLHSKRPELLEGVERGDAFLTRLEGEWCMRFSQNAAVAPSTGPMPRGLIGLSFLRQSKTS